MISKEQIAIISEQLGRTPIGALEVVTLDRDKQPAVLKVDPLADGKPFPSMYWLTSPLLHKAISHIESTAWIKEFENITLPQNEEYKNRLKADNENYRKLRWDLFQTLHRSEEVSPAFVKVIKESGIGGIQSFDRVRCLHMHYAYHLVHGGLVGELLDKQFNLGELVYTNDN
tara:strand:- start:464 stop:979 length:516 start_codon:yes stop_codon:yes gene_type:complete